MPQSQAPEPEITDTDQGRWQGRCGDFFPKAKPAKKCDDPTDWDSPAFYATLPHDPAQLYKKLQNLTKGRGSTPAAMFHFGTEILRAGQMPAELRAQWYRALAKIPGMTVLAAETNLDGRTGVALGLDDRHEIRQLIIDPATGGFIGERTVAGAEPSEAWIKPRHRTRCQRDHHGGGRGARPGPGPVATPDGRRSAGPSEPSSPSPAPNRAKPGSSPAPNSTPAPSPQPCGQLGQVPAR